EIATRKTTELAAAATTNPAPPATEGERRQRPEPRRDRGRQYTAVLSPDGKYEAVYRDRNLWLRPAGETNETAITTEGSERTRVKFGTANWVYGEELNQT